MKTINRNHLVKMALLVLGSLFFYTATFSKAHADSHCKLVCTDLKTAVQECVFVPTGCNNKENKLGVPKAQLEQLINPKLVNPKLINPKRKMIPGDQFKPNKKFLPGDQFKTN